MIMEFIRKAGPEDKKQIYRLMEVLEETKIDYRLFEEVYDSNLLNPLVFYYVFEKDDVILGFISIHVQKLLHHTANIAEIQELIVDESVRNQGIGKRLIQTAKDIAVDNNCQLLEVCCSQRRLFSHKFYESQGMTNKHFKFCLPL